MKWGEYYKKLRQWEAEGYDVSELKQKWFPEEGGTGRSRAWMPVVVGMLDLAGGVSGLIAVVAIWPQAFPFYPPPEGEYWLVLIFALIIGLTTIATVGGILDTKGTRRTLLLALGAPLLVFSLTVWVASTHDQSHQAVVAGPMISLNTVAVVGGVSTIKRKSWGLALAAAICVLTVGFLHVDAVFVFGCLILGIAAITFTILGRSRFK